jgi:hypothetical protein
MAGCASLSRPTDLSDIDREKIPEKKRWLTLQVKLRRFFVRIADLHGKEPLIIAMAQNNFVVDQGSASLGKPGSDDQNRQSENFLAIDSPDNSLLPTQN